MVSVRRPSWFVRAVNGAILVVVACLGLTTRAHAQTLETPVPEGGFSTEAFQSNLFTGAATYSIPIPIPPGINGMAPALSLTYNSGAGNGWTGVGWMLDVGSIARPPHKPDTFVLRHPGGSVSKLVAVSVDANGAGEYRTNPDSFLKIIYTGTAWTVTDKSGRQQTFGASAAARTGPNPTVGAETVQWNVEEAVDPSGNAIRYRYVKDRNQLYLDRVEYTANATLALSPKRTVKFYLEARPDLENSFGRPFTITTALRLKSLEIISDVSTGQRAGAWAFAYGQSQNSGRSLVTSITRYGADVTLDATGTILGGSALPSMTFTYHDTREWSFDTRDWPTGQQAIDWRVDGHEQILTGDFNGDGRTDVAHARSQWSLWRVSLSTGSGFQPAADWATGAFAIDWLPDSHEEVITGDFNGDGKTDVAHSRSQTGFWRVSLSTGSGFQPAADWATGAFAIDNRADGNEMIITGDFNGDGKTDVAHARSGWGAWRVSLSTGSGFQTADWTTGPFAIDWLPDGHEEVITGDFNGDGKTDIAHARSQWGFWRVSLSTGSGFVTQDWPTNGFLAIDNRADGLEAIVTGDFDGDGRTDVAHARTGWSLWRVSLSTGSGFTTQNWSISPYFALKDTGSGSGFGRIKRLLMRLNEAVITDDFNGDGRTDIAYAHNGLGHWQVSVSTGSGLITQEWPTSPYAALDFLGDGHEQIIVGDLNGDGRADIGHARSQWSGWRVSSTQQSNAPDRLVRIDNGLGATASLSYTPSTRHPDHLVPLALWTLTESTASTTKFDGTPWSATTRYAYTGGRWSVPDKEFRGFAEATVTDSAGTRTTVAFHQDEVKKGRVASRRVEDAAGRLFARLQLTYTDASTFPGVFWPRLDRLDTFQHDGQLTPRQTAVAFQYDAHGNRTRIADLGDVAIAGDDRETLTDWVVDATAWLHRPSHAAVHDAAGQLLSEDWLSYDGRGLLTRAESRLAGPQGDAGNPAVAHTYDAFGHRTATTDARGATISITYETTFQTYPLTITSPLTANVPSGLVTTLAYDVRFGVLTSLTDPNNQTTTSQYDPFGRLTAETDPLGQTATISYDAFGTAGSQRISTRLPDGTLDGLWREEYFDGLGRTFKTREEAAAGQVVVSERNFDNRGMVSQTSLPRFEGEAALWTTFAYDDPLRRLTRTTFPDGTAEQIAYTISTTTLTDRKNRLRSSVTDAYGRLTQITEPDGSTGATYAYDALDRLTSVTDAAGNGTSVTYDLLGRKISMTEPNVGTWTYGYDLNTNLTSQTDVKGQTLTFAYDALNRLTTKTYPGGATIRFTYDAGINGKGRQTGMTDLAGSASYTYDAVGRQASITRVIDGVSYNTQATYTALDQPLTLTYPDGEVVRYAYDAGGQVLSVSGAEPKPYASNLTYNAAGQLTLMQSGNGIATGFLYDPATLRLTHRHAYAATHPTAPLRSWATSWDGAPQGYATLYRGGICVVDAAGTCIGGDVKGEAGVGPVVGYMKTTAEPGTVPAYQTHCYSNAAGTCVDWGLSLEAGGLLVGYLATTAPDAQSAGAPLTRSGGLLLQKLTGGAPSAYLWTSQTVAVTANTDHVYTSDALDVPGYTPQATVLDLDPSPGAGLVPLYRFANAVTDHHYYSTTSDAPVGFTQEQILGYLHATAEVGLVPLYRFYHPTTGDYLLSTSSVPPTGYQAQTVLGYGHRTIQDVHYAYDAVGNVTAITDHHTPGNSQTFAYDALDRLVTATGAYGTQPYTYNAIGNLLSKAGVTYTYPVLGQAPTAQTCNRVMPHAVTATSDGKSYGYDCNGNLVSDGERTLSWDADDRPILVMRTGTGATTFAYDGDGARVKKVGPTRTVRYLGSFEDHVTDTATVKHIFAGPLRVATRVVGPGPTAGTYFVHGDHLESLNVLTNGASDEVQRLTYQPFGTTQSHTGSVDFDFYRFTGQELDPETGLYDYGARYYHADLGRFVSADSLVPDLFDPQSLNRYSYALNNPVRFTDPTGLSPRDDCVLCLEAHVGDDRPDRDRPDHVRPDRPDTRETFLPPRPDVENPQAPSPLSDPGTADAPPGPNNATFFGTGDLGLNTEVPALLGDPQPGIIPVASFRRGFPDCLDCLIAPGGGGGGFGGGRGAGRGGFGGGRGGGVGRGGGGGGGGAGRGVGGPATGGRQSTAISGRSGITDALSGLRAGRSARVRLVASEAELESLFARLSAGGKPVPGTTYPGGRLVRLPDGTTVGLRPTSTSGGPTIDVFTPEGKLLRRVHVE